MDDVADALFPRPRHLEVGGAGPPTPSVELAAVAASDLEPEAYRLTIDAHGARLEFGSEAGRRYGEQTFAHIAAAFPARLPQLRIDDAPDFAHRSFSLDISRDRVPTRGTLDRLVELLALARYNQLQLYTEHTFAYRDHETVWRDASPITADDLRWLAEVCAAHGIELVVCQNSLGHFERWLRHDAYRDRAECPEGAELMPGVTMPPDTLAPTEANAAFVGELVREQLAAVPSRWVNICADEPFQLGKGRSRDDVADRGRAAVYTDYVRRVVAPLAADGHQVLFYGDVVRDDPRRLDELPDAAVPVGWCYEAPRPPGDRIAIPDSVAPILDSLGIDLDGHLGMHANVAPLAATGRPFWVAPGTSSWNSLVGRIDNAAGNLVDAADVGAELGASGYLVTDWGDNGHLQPPSVGDGPTLLGGAVSWCAATNRGIDLAATLDRFVYHDRSGRAGSAVVTLGELWGRTGLQAFNCSPLFSAVVPSLQLVVGDLDADRTAGVVAAIDAAIDHLRAADLGCADADVVRHELTVAAGFARQGAWRLLARHGHPSAPTAADLRADLERLVEEQRTAWLARARPGGLDDSIARLDPIRQEAT